MSSAKIPNCESPSTWLTYDNYLDRDRGVVPDILRERGEDTDTGAMEVDARCFYSREYSEREVERLWSRAWLFACRENDIPKMGDWVEFSIADQSVLVVRDSNRFDPRDAQCVPPSRYETRSGARQ
jgi:hypothetical protein